MKTFRLLSLLFLMVFLCTEVWAQDLVFQTFKDRRVINVQSVETLPKRKLDVRIAHRFGDVAGDNGGFKTVFGLENARDVLLGAEYGVSDNLTLGVFRTKGAGVLPDGTPGLRQILNGVYKVRLIRQKESEGAPFTLTAVGITSLSTAEKIEEATESIQSFPKFAHRLAHHVQLMAARKFSDGLSLQVNAGYTYRNLVPSGDVNGLFSVGGAARIQLSKVVGIIADLTVPFSDNRTADNGFYPALGLGFEFETGGHVFQVNFTNATAIMETDFIPYTTTSWGQGEFRLGFTVSRIFNL
jgi:hypothetical protein